MIRFLMVVFYFTGIGNLKVKAQNIADFLSIVPGTQTSDFKFPSGTHRFQKIIEEGETIDNGVIGDRFDFTCFVPYNSQSDTGHLTISHEISAGGLTAMRLGFDPIGKLWKKYAPINLDFSVVNGTSNNCSGGLTPWNTVITCEEVVNTSDSNSDGYYDRGWHVEVNPVTGTVLHKLYALGNGKKENICFHENGRTAYFGNDDYPGYLYKFVAFSANDLTSGELYVYIGPKNGDGIWQLVPNSSIGERNSTMSICAGFNATSFNGIEDVEIGPDGAIYFAVKNDDAIYKFRDSDPINGTVVNSMQLFAGGPGMQYDVNTIGGSAQVPWGTGNDNLAFDGQGNLWVLQDGSNNYIWVLMNGHSQQNPDVRLFGIAPAGSEPTGITFSPDFKYLFMSFQHPAASNNVTYQKDAAGNQVGFDKDIAIVIALKNDLGCEQTGMACDDGDASTIGDTISPFCICTGIPATANAFVQVNSGNDDVEQNNTTGAVEANSTDLELVTDGTVNQTVGLRFNNIEIPKGATIDNAFLQFAVDEPQHISTTNVAIKAGASDNAPPFTLASFELSDRAKSTDSVLWEIPIWTNANEAGPLQQSPDLKMLVQKLVDRPGWASGNSISFFITGAGRRTAHAYNGNALLAPKLIYTYTLVTHKFVGINTLEPKSALHVADGDVYIDGPVHGLIMRSSNGTCWKLKVSDTGMLVTEPVVCP